MPQPFPKPADDAEPDYVPTIADGHFGRFAIDARGNWRYTQLPTTNRLSAGQQATERFEVRRGDGSVATVAITVIGHPDDEWPWMAPAERPRGNAPPV